MLKPASLPLVTTNYCDYELQIISNSLYICNLLLFTKKAMQKTLVILKPDCVARGLTGEVTTRFEKK